MGDIVLIFTEFEVDVGKSFLSAVDRHGYHQAFGGFNRASLHHAEIIGVAVFLFRLVLALEEYAAFAEFLEKGVASEWQSEYFGGLRD